MSPDAQLQRARDLLDIRRPAEAESLLRDHLAHEPASADALALMATALSEQARLPEAIDFARSAVAQDPHDAWHHVLLADLLSQQGEHVDAVAVARRAVELDPHSWVTHCILAQAMLAEPQPRLQDAYRSAYRAVDLNPLAPEAHNMIGLCLDELGSHAQARQAFENALRIDPMSVSAMNNLAVQDMEGGRLAGAARGLRATLNVDPQERIARQNLDSLILRLGIRMMLAVLGTGLLVGFQLAQGLPWLARASTTVAVLGLLAFGSARFTRHLPRGLRLWDAGLWRRVGWAERLLLVVFLVAVSGVLIMGLAPHSVAVASASALARAVRVTNSIILVSLAVGAAWRFWKRRRRA